MSRAKSDDTRERLLDAATRLIVERGYHQVGMDEIARVAGVSRQAVYQGHFRNKAELLLALLARADELADVPRRVGRMREAHDGVQALEIAVEVVTSIERDIHDCARVFDAARTADPAFETAWQDRMRLRRGFSRAAVHRLEAEGRLADGWTAEEAVTTCGRPSRPQPIRRWWSSGAGPRTATWRCSNVCFAARWSASRRRAEGSRSTRSRF